MLLIYVEVLCIACAVHAIVFPIVCDRGGIVLNIDALIIEGRVDGSKLVQAIKLNVT